MELLKRRGASPMKLITSKPNNVEESGSTNHVQSNTVPIIRISNECSTETDVIFPRIPESFSSPLFGSTISAIQNKLRKFSNMSNESSDIPTPDFSPISFMHSPLSFLRCLHNSAKKQPFETAIPNTCLNNSKIMNKRITSLADLSGLDNSVLEENKDSGKPRNRSKSHYIPQARRDSGEFVDYMDDVFEVFLANPKREYVTYAKPNKSRQFAELLRRHSLDSCVNLFQEHEIDLDVFLTLTSGDLHEIGIDWDKRDRVLNVINQLKSYM